MRLLILCALLVLVAPASVRAVNQRADTAMAPASVHVSAFYYPWYGTAALDGAYQHWAQDGHTPPNDIESGTGGIQFRK